ncbi:MAG: aminotransferase class III-fold pyridoxal phosphate-dependent enzyme, partial [Myxococcales bacterium]|nr:aminotransferase class III-fold pyridoxal phosphate-dependent enzyme [Myxococcales bacterium]
LGASFPISACIGSEAAMQAWARGGEVVHTSTHAGAPIGCAAALATLNEVASRGLARRARTLGERLLTELRRALAGAPAVVDVRGRGLITGIELRDGPLGLATARKLLERGYLVTVGGRAGEVIVLTPPLTIAEPILLSVVPELRELLESVGA